MKPEPAEKMVGCVNDNLESAHICTIIQGEATWFGNHFGCDYGHLMEQHFIIKRDLPIPYFELTDEGFKQMELLELKDINLHMELFNYIEMIWDWKAKMETLEYHRAAKKFLQIKGIKKKILRKLNNNKMGFIRSCLNYHLFDLRPEVESQEMMMPTFKIKLT